jgi:beta-glucosidase-like glycosyl hydrolase/CubicO group peptidase (beta-lactamase class C family)
MGLPAPFPGSGLFLYIIEHANNGRTETFGLYLFMAFGKRFFTLVSLFILHCLSCFAQYNRKASDKEILHKQHWVDSVYNKLSDTERIGQLFMVQAYSGTKDYNEDSIKVLLQNNRIGGIIFMQGTAEKQVCLNNMYQQMANVPLLVAMDAEWGLGMRLTGAKDLPRSMMIGASHDTKMAYAVGAAIGQQCKRMGVHVNFAPVADINNNPNNPVIGARSYGENKIWVTRLAVAYMNGLQDNGVMACGKHFPGHGDTDADSHLDLPRIPKSLTQLDTLELYPFRQLIKAGLKTMMVAHLDVPALETEQHIPTTLSKNTITNLLKTKMGFNGLVFTDALNMKGITKYFAATDINLRALQVGNDMLLIAQEVPASINRIKQALDSGEVSRAQLEATVKKILSAKYDAGLWHWTPIDSTNATKDINAQVVAIRTEMARQSVTLIRDKNSVLTGLSDKRKKIGYVGVNATDTTMLLRRLMEERADINFQYLPKSSSASVLKKLISDVNNDNDITIVGIHNMSLYPLSSGNYSLDDIQVSFIKQMATRKNTMLALMGNPYLLKNACDVNSVVVAYEDDSIAENQVAKVLLRQDDAIGVMPVTPCNGMVTEGAMMLAKAKPAVVKQGELSKTDFVEDAGVKNTEALDKLDMFIQRSIADGVFPGCRIVASKNGKVFYNKSFGYYDYNKKVVVTDNTIYDVASVTKVLSTTLAVMHLYENGKLKLDKTIGDYLSWTEGSNKANLKIRDLLLHQAGMKSWIPFYKETLDEKGNPSDNYYSNTSSKEKSIEVAKSLYLRNDYKDTIWNRVLTSPLENKGKYVYSDLDYYFLAAIVEQITGQRIDKYVDEQFYKPLGLANTTYLPLKKYKESQIAPTENDNFFRHQLLQGYVDDEGAAMLGGVAGHAGVFATANDVAVVFQMLLQKGSYGGERYFKKETIEKFTAYNTPLSRRGLGFDKPAADKDDAGPAGNRSSASAFGHQGFTGTCAWADPTTGIVFVFLSNRVQPSRENNAINKMSVRTIAQDYIYEALGVEINHNRPEDYKKVLSQHK